MEWSKRGLKEYWKRREHRRLDGEGGRRRPRRSKVELGGGRRRRFWRIKISPRLQFLRILSPKRILGRIRDAYVNMMLAFANSAALGYGGDSFEGFMPPAVKEYDERMILQIYKSMMAEGRLIATTGATAPSVELAVRR